MGGRDDPAGRGAFAGAVLGPVLARPKVFAAVGVLVLLALAAPAVGMKTEQLGMEKQFGSDAALSIAHQRITAAFPGGPEPARVVVRVRAERADLLHVDVRGSYARPVELGEDLVADR